jgi:hypothetical protein
MNIHHLYPWLSYALPPFYPTFLRKIQEVEELEDRPSSTGLTCPTEPVSSPVVAGAGYVPELLDAHVSAVKEDLHEVTCHSSSSFMASERRFPSSDDQLYYLRDFPLTLRMTRPTNIFNPLDLDSALHLLSAAERVICDLRSRLATNEGSGGCWGREGDSSGVWEAAGGANSDLGTLVF